MPLYTYGLHTPPELPERVTIDGIEYRRIQRLPRNLRPGDLLAIGDNTDPAGYHRAYVEVTGVDTYPQELLGWNRFPPQCVVTFRLRPEDDVWRWRTWGRQMKFRDQETKEPVTWAYRAVKRGQNK